MRQQIINILFLQIVSLFVFLPNLYATTDCTDCRTRAQAVVPTSLTDVSNAILQSTSNIPMQCFSTNDQGVVVVELSRTNPFATCSCLAQNTTTQIDSNSFDQIVPVIQSSLQKTASSFLINRYRAYPRYQAYFTTLGVTAPSCSAIEQNDYSSCSNRELAEYMRQNSAQSAPGVGLLSRLSDGNLQDINRRAFIQFMEAVDSVSKSVCTSGDFACLWAATTDKMSYQEFRHQYPEHAALSDTQLAQLFTTSPEMMENFSSMQRSIRSIGAVYQRTMFTANEIELSLNDVLVVYKQIKRDRGAGPDFNTLFTEFASSTVGELCRSYSQAKERNCSLTPQQAIERFYRPEDPETRMSIDRSVVENSTNNAFLNQLLSCEILKNNLNICHAGSSTPRCQLFNDYLRSVESGLDTSGRVSLLDSIRTMSQHSYVSSDVTSRLAASNMLTGGAAVAEHLAEVQVYRSNRVFNTSLENLTIYSRYTGVIQNVDSGIIVAPERMSLDGPSSLDSLGQSERQNYVTPQGGSQGPSSTIPNAVYNPYEQVVGTNPSQQTLTPNAPSNLRQTNVTPQQAQTGGGQSSMSENDRLRARIAELERQREAEVSAREIERANQEISRLRTQLDSMEHTSAPPDIAPQVSGAQTFRAPSAIEAVLPSSTPTVANPQGASGGSSGVFSRYDEGSDRFVSLREGSTLAERSNGIAGSVSGGDAAERVIVPSSLQSSYNIPSEVEIIPGQDFDRSTFNDEQNIVFVSRNGQVEIYRKIASAGNRRGKAAYTLVEVVSKNIFQLATPSDEFRRADLQPPTRHEELKEQINQGV